MITLDITNDWNLVDVDNISGRLNVMWLTPEGVGISTRKYSHMTILNMICEKSNNHDFWDIEEMKKHNIDDLVQGGERVLYAAICVIGSLIFLGLLLVSYLASLIPLI